MMNNNWGFGLGPFGFGGGLLFALLLIWSLTWKALGLWRAARTGSKAWFIAILVVNTLGILEILYLYVFSKKSTPPATPSQTETK